MIQCVMDLLQSMEAFVRVAEAESVGSAARQLGVAKSVVTTRVKQLEEHFGAALFHRSTRAFKLSEVGQRYYESCRDILARVGALSDLSEQERGGLRGTLRIQVLPGFGIGHFSKAVVDFRALHPGIVFDVFVNDRVVDPVQEGFDLVIQIYPPASNSLIERKLFPVRGLFCAAPHYLAEESPIETPLDLLRHDFARYAYYPWGDRWPISGGSERFEIALSPVLKTNSVHLLLEFARGGAGIAYLPTMVAAPDLLEKRLTHVLPGYSAPPLWLSAVYPASHRSTARVKTFIDFLRMRFPTEPQWDKALGLPPLEAAADDESLA